VSKSLHIVLTHYTVGSHFATVLRQFTFMTLVQSDRVQSTPDFWYITVATQVPFLYLVRF